MPGRRRWRALVASLACLAGGLLPLAHSDAAFSTNENARTLVLSLPGPFNGCGYLDPGATPTSDAIGDLLLPSAFITNADGTLVGEDGPIASAELTSLSPETVRYALAPNEIWSDGATFTGVDLVAWWQRAKSLSSVVSDGYRAIKSLTLSRSGLSVTAVFAQPYAEWDLLFRDVEAVGTPPGCALSGLLSRPTLGPYVVSSATANRLVLLMNPNWPLDPGRFGRVVITDAQSLPSAGDPYADYTLDVSATAIEAISSHPTLLSRITSSSDIEELTFSPHALLTSALSVRQALSWSIQRQSMIDKIFGLVTFSPSVAASALYSQGQAQYPGGSGYNPVGQATTTTTVRSTNGLNDCASCAVAALRASGFRRTSAGWVDGVGQLVSVQLAVGPNVLDHLVAAIAKRDWAALGLSATLVDESSEIAAATAAATGRADVAVFLRPTTTTPSYAARSWVGSAFPDAYSSGVRIAAVAALFGQALAIFNPVTAASTWLRLDQVVMTDFWVRPLFTPPSLVVWSSSLTEVLNSVTVPGFVDQLPAWSITPPTPIT